MKCGYSSRRKKERIVLKCLQCNKEFKVLPSRIRKFCCKRCLWNYNKIARLGIGNPMWGKETSELQKESIRKRNTGRKAKPSTIKKMKKSAKIRQIKLWEDPIYKESQLRLQRKGQGIRPNKPEKIVIDIIEKNNFSFKYVGNGTFWIDSSFNPDFIDIDKKLIIEVFGDYWHNIPKARIRDKKRLKAYSDWGYRTLIIWEHELVKGEIVSVINKIKCFLTKSFHNFSLDFVQIKKKNTVAGIEP